MFVVFNKQTNPMEKRINCPGSVSYHTVTLHENDLLYNKTSWVMCIIL